MSEGSAGGTQGERGPAEDAPRGIGRFVPILHWLPRYKRSWLVVDAVAGLSVWALMVPQGLAYATLAGVPVQFGLYTAFAALIGYAVFGTAKQVVQGPSAAVASITAAAITPIVGAAALGTDKAVGYAAALAVLAAGLYIVLRFLRMGWISNFLSSAVMGGFILGFAFGIIIDQSYKILGVPKPEDGSYMQKLVQTIQEIPETSLVTLAVGATCLVVLLLMRYLLPKWPRALIVVVLSILAVTALDLATHGVAVTGPVPTGLFTVQLPGVGWSDMSNLLAGAVAIVFVGFSESLASGRAMARKHDYRLDNNQELLAQAGACGLAGLVGGFATDGSLSKTSVADTAGQRTQMASLIDALLILLTMLFLASLFEDLPKAALGAVVIDAMIGLISFKEPKRYWSVNRSEIWFFLIAMLGLLFIGIIAGILLGLVASTTALVWRASKPPLRRLGWDAKAGRFTDADRHEGLELEPGVLLTRLDGPLFFADAARFGDGIVQMVDEADPPPGGVVVDVEAVSQTDTDGADALIDLHKSLGSRGIALAIARVESDVLALWERAGVVDVIGAEHVFSTPRDGEDHLLREIEEGRYRGDKAHPANEEGP